MKNVIICADHNIGFNVINYILKNNSKLFNIIDIYTTTTNNQGFWKPLKGNKKFRKSIKIFYDNKQFYNDIKLQNIDYIFLISWKHLISESIIAKINIGIINLHYSLLPKYRGVYPVNNSIIYGEKISGITYHWINKNIDCGSIIYQKNLKIESIDTASSLLKRLDKLAFKKFKRIWSGKIKLVIRKNPINELNSQYYSKKDFELTNELDLSKEYLALELLNLIRGKTFKNRSSLYYIDNNNEKIFIALKFFKEKDK